ncbi:hypothetical protein ACVBAX_15440 [Robertmurraya sp. GLU-23]
MFKVINFKTTPKKARKKRTVQLSFQNKKDDSKDVEIITFRSSGQMNKRYGI